MITGLGVDIVEIDRMALALERTPAHQGAALLGRGAGLLRQARPARGALRAALRGQGGRAQGARDRLLRACGSPTSRSCARASGRPVPKLQRRAAERAEELGIVEMHLSLSFTHSTAVASAVAITEGSRPRKDERPDPKAAARRVVQGGARAA